MTAPSSARRARPAKCDLDAAVESVRAPARTPIRQVVGLRWVRPAKSPWGRPRARGAALAGLRFEDKVAQLLGLRRGVWLEYEDANGRGFASPDGLARYAGGLLAVECKLTDTPAAWTQLEGLYRPLLEHLARVPVFTLVVVKNLTPRSDQFQVVADLGEALRRAERAIPTTLHLPWPEATKAALHHHGASLSA